MGLILNGNNINKPYLDGQKVNAYLNGQKIWNDNASLYYNGWQHDLPEPDWNALNNTIPSACQFTAIGITIMVIAVQHTQNGTATLHKSGIL